VRIGDKKGKKPARAMRARVPKRLLPYFQEYRAQNLKANRDADLIIQRTLEYGSWREIRWLFQTYGTRRINRFLRELGERALSRVAFNYWRRLLGVKKWKKSPFRISSQEVWPHS
jgi:hypothetical protein